MIKQLTLLICFLSFFGHSGRAQQNNFNYKAVEAKIRKHIYSSADSTKYYINYALSQKTLPDSIRGAVYNIYGIYYGNMGKTDSSIYYYKKAIAQLKNYPKIKTMPLMNIAVAYRNKGEYDTSFQILNEALELSKKLNMKVFEASVYSHMASNYQFTLEYEKSIECLLKGIAIVKKEEDKSSLVNMNQKLANTYMKMRNFTFAKDLYKECLAIFKANNDKGNHALTLINYAECVIHLDEVEEAKRSLREALIELQDIKNEEHMAVAYSKLANIAAYEQKHNVAHTNYTNALAIFLKGNSMNTVVIGAEFIEYLNRQKKYDEALKVIDAVKKSTMFSKANSEDRLRFDVATAETNKNTNNHKEAAEGLEEAIKLKDSIARTDNNEAINELQARLQKELQQEKSRILSKRNNSLQQEKDAKNKLTFLYVFASIFFIIIVLLFLRSLWLKNRLQNEALRHLNAEKNLAMQQQEYEHEFANSQKEIIAEKQRELTSTALRLANYQDNINEIIEKCDNGQIKDTAQLKKDLTTLLKQKDYWKQFETRFNNLHPDFAHSLASQYSKLTKNDIEFCSLLKLNLSNKEIATLLQISHESTITKKYRIKKKMEINDDSEFEKILMEI
ncbi:tetratricopeptide repeat protein [Flavobacterium suzhouense]|uniref:Tetratricopeptide repeat protein n=1 Tax=Flavobacterium suzhouense TaxID=1529638 RepID=A0ABW5NSI6_9FLAO